jgi:hypothetical protein
VTKTSPIEARHSLLQTARDATPLARKAIAPPGSTAFRTLASRYPIDSLQAALAEGIVSGHPDMPIFVISPRDVDAIIRYLQSIQSRADQP